MRRVVENPRAAADLDRALGLAIRVRRTSLNLTQDYLADACGISFQQIQKYESGSNRISFSRLVQIATALECRVADLTGALDFLEAEPDSLDVLQLMSLPGALDLLKKYAGIDPEGRRLLVELLQNLQPDRG